MFEGVSPESIPSLLLKSLDESNSETTRRSATESLRGMLHCVNVDVSEASPAAELFQYALSHFVSIAGPLKPNALSTAANALLTFSAAQVFKCSTEMQLDCVNFAVFLLGHEDRKISAEGRDLLNAVAVLAELRNNVDILVATNSAFALFPGS
jgi:hypothetical protein